MAYCTTADVQTRLGSIHTLTVSSVPSTTQVEGFITARSALVDSYLTRAGYSTVPATGANDLALLLDVVAKVVTLDVVMIAFSRGGSSAQDAAYLEWLREGLLWLNRLATGEVELVDQSPARNGFVISYSTIYGASS